MASSGRKHAITTAKPSIRQASGLTVQPLAKRVDPFYLSKEWRQLLAHIIAIRGRICEDKGCDGRTHKPGMRVFGDHIIEIRDGGAPLDPANIMLRCGASHTRKTATVRAARLAAWEGGAQSLGGQGG